MLGCRWRMWFSSNSQSQICLEKVSWIPTHSNWKRILVKTERQRMYLCEELSDTWQWDLAYESRAWIEDELHWNEYDQMMCGVKLNERKKSEELRELLGLEPVSLIIKKSRLRWFGHVEQKDQTYQKSHQKRWLDQTYNVRSWRN